MKRLTLRRALVGWSQQGKYTVIRGLHTFGFYLTTTNSIMPETSVIVQSLS